jgi:hypothetical protein
MAVKQQPPEKGQHANKCQSEENWAPALPFACFTHSMTSCFFRSAAINLSMLSRLGIDPPQIQVQMPPIIWLSLLQSRGHFSIAPKNRQNLFLFLCFSGLNRRSAGRK